MRGGKGGTLGDSLVIAATAAIAALYHIYDGLKIVAFGLKRIEPVKQKELLLMCASLHS